MKHITILSTKSAGSTAVQKYFKKNHGFKTVVYTEHQEEETLYWTKVASILKKSQLSMYRSVVPLSVSKAVDSLNYFFVQNGLPEIQCNEDSKQEDFELFYFKLISKFGPRFIEKSPHHLYNESNLKLIADFQYRYKNVIEFYNIGLVRHPQAVLYSAWKRWKYLPNKFEQEWHVSYLNLLNWKISLNIKIVKYEILVNHKSFGESILNEKPLKFDFSFKKGSVDKWKKDSRYGHILKSATKELLNNFGYQDFKLKRKITYLVELKWYSTIFNIKKSIKNQLKNDPNKSRY